MPEQLIFTSKPTGIQPGRSGFQIVAQHSTINHRLAAALEKESIYEISESSHALPIICKYQRFEIGNDRFAVLTRTQSCGVDFTGRPNHIAHHLIFDLDELPACPPAAIFALWKGWRQKWDNKPRFLGGWDRVNYENEAEPFFYTRFALPAKTWKASAGDEGCAAIPILNESEHLLFPFKEGKEDALVWLFLESQSLVSHKKAWDITFTNYRIENDNLSNFQWIGFPEANGETNIGLESETIRLFDKENTLEAPDHELAEKARTSLNLPKPPAAKKSGSAISIAPVEDGEPIQDELGLEGVDKTAPLEIQDELLETEATSSLPDQHSDEVFGDIFKPDEKTDSKTKLDFDVDESSFPDSEHSWFQRFRFPIIFLLLLIAVICAALFAPGLLAIFNHQSDPAPMKQDTAPSKEEIQLKERILVAEMDPDARFANQIGASGQIIESGQFLLARAFLSKYRNDPEKSQSSDFITLENWYNQQKALLADINQQLNQLDNEVAEKRVIPDFDSRKSSIEDGIERLAEDLQSSIQDHLDEVNSTYKEWLNKVRLKTANVPTFFIPISREQANPEITFTNIPELAQDWLAGLDQFPVTAQIEHIQIQVSPFRGLNRFELSLEDAVALSLWKHSERSLISYLDGQTEVIEIVSDPANLSKISFHWRFDASKGAAASTFPEPPIILNFLNTLTNQALNVVMMGGVSQTSTAPADVPISFLKMDQQSYQIEVTDPVLKEKLELFMLPPDRFLQLKSLDEHYFFAWDPATSAFHLYESKDFESSNIRSIQEKISIEHSILTKLNRQKTISDSVSFIRQTPLWSLGVEVLGENCPSDLKTFGDYFQKDPKNYFDYLRALMNYFASEYTLIRPAVMEKWIAYPKDQIPQTQEAILTYRNMLLRTSKRFRSLLKQENQNSLEDWRNFVTNLEFWLLGEHQQQLVDVLSLTADEIAVAETTDAAQVEQDISKTTAAINALQSQLENSSNLTQISKIDKWLLEMTSMSDPNRATPLIFFREF